MPAFSFEKSLAKSYVKYEACNENNKCIKGEAFNNLHTVSELPSSKLRIVYQTCVLSLENNGETCSEEGVYQYTFHPVKDSPVLQELITEQEKLESQLLQKSKEIKDIVHELSSELPQCRGVYKINPSAIDLIEKINTLSLDETFEALSIGGDIGDLYDLSQIEDERIKELTEQKIAEERQAREVQEHTLIILRGVLLAGSVFGLVASINTTADWWRYIQKNRVVVIGQKEQKLHRDGDFLYATFDGQRYKFFEDPQTKRIYYIHETGDIPNVFNKNNDRIQRLDIPEGMELQQNGLIKKGSEFYHPYRTENGLFSEKLDILETVYKPRSSPEIKQTAAYKNAKKNYLDRINKARSHYDPMFNGKFTSLKMERAKRGFSVLVAASSVILSGMFFANQFNLYAKDLSLPEKCQKSSKLLNDFNFIFKSANDLYSQLVIVRAEIYIIL